MKLCEYLSVFSNQGNIELQVSLKGSNGVVFKRNFVRNFIFKFLFLSTLALSAQASNFKDYRVGMTSKEAQKLGLYHCRPGVIQNKFNGSIIEGSTECRISIDDEIPQMYGGAEVIFDNKTKKITEIKALIYPSQFEKPVEGRPISREAIQSWVDDQLLVRYKVGLCEKNYFHNGWRHGLKTCLYHPDTIRTISGGYQSRKRIIRLATAIEIHIRVNKQEYKKLLKEAMDKEKLDKAIYIKKQESNAIARDIENGK